MKDRRIVIASRRRRLAPLLFLWAAGTAGAQVQLDFSPATLDLSIGQSALVEVRVTGVPAAGLAAFQLDLTFEPVPIDVLNPNEAHRGVVDPFAPLGGDPLCPVVRNTAGCSDPAWLLTSTGRTPVGTDTIDNPTGFVQIAYGTHGAAAPPASDGTIALIEVLGAWDGTVDVGLSEVILADAAEPPATFATATATLTVVVGTGVANLPPVLSPIGPRQVYEELSLSIPIAASDPDGDGLSLSAAGLPGFCALTDDGGGSGSLDCAPLAGDAGVYPVTVVATDDGGPNLSDQEAFDLTVDPTNCVDADGDGFGLPGDPSCARGAPEDCDDANAAVNPDALERCRNGLDDDCDGAADAVDPICLAPVCVIVGLDATPGDPDVAFAPPAACPGGGVLARPVDVVWGDSASLAIAGSDVALGAVSQVICAGTLSVQLFDNLRPDPGGVDFFLARETGQPGYGSGSGGLQRTASQGDCP